MMWLVYDLALFGAVAFVVWLIMRWIDRHFARVRKQSLERRNDSRES